MGDSVASFGFTCGCANVILGTSAAYNGMSGIQNIAIGSCAFFGRFPPSTGSNNVAIGAGSQYEITGGTQNIAIGNNALYCVQNGCQNVAIGGSNTGFCSVGNGNVYIGACVAPVAVGSYQNIFIGWCAAPGYIAGSCNIIIGSCASLASGNNRVLIQPGGGTGASFAAGATGWTFTSDARDKSEITALPAGLAVVKELQPRTYEWTPRNVKLDENRKAVGFISQEVRSVLENHLPDYVEDIAPYTEETDTYGVAESKFVPILVKAVQELSSQLEDLKSDFDAYVATHP
jgi:hypothetical protein